MEEALSLSPDRLLDDDDLKLCHTFITYNCTLLVHNFNILKINRLITPYMKDLYTNLPVVF